MAHTGPPHGGSYVPQGGFAAQQLSTPTSSSSANAHGGNYVPGSSNMQPMGSRIPSQGAMHGGGLVPGQVQSYSYGGQTPPPQTYNAASQIMPAPPHGQSMQSNPMAYHTKVGRTQPPLQEKSLDTQEYVGSTVTEIAEKPRTRHRNYQKGYQNIFHHAARWKWKFPNSYQEPGYRYDALDKRRHRDIMQRVWEGAIDDRYLSPWDGHVAKLVVQAVDEVYNSPATSTWRRTFIRNVSPVMLRIANWPFNSVTIDSSHWTDAEWTSVCLKWIPASVALLFVMSYPTVAEGQMRNNGYYDALPYKWWGYAKMPRNPFEESTPRHLTPRHEKRTNPVSERLLRPRYLCFLRKPGDREMHGVDPMSVDERISSHGADQNLDYLFIAYTAEQFLHTSGEDMEALHQIAERATRDAGLPAYWVGCSCMPDPSEMEEDVYRISDIMRGAQALVIVVGAQAGDRETPTTKELLKEWGKRMWTLPEALLSPEGREILVFTRGQSLDSPLRVSKKNFAALAWDDAAVTRQLIDHYEGSLILSRLELVILALYCLNNRQTTEYFRGDMSYALMGLLRLRPKVDSTDSAFQAFARLSLANDSDMLLERLICTLPTGPNQSDLTTEDAWNISLWDIYPTCQIAGVGHDDTVILDGVFGAAIRWKAFALVATSVRDSWRRLGARTCLRGSPYLFYLGIVLVAIQGTGDVTKAIGAIFLIWAIIVTLLSPYLVRLIYGGKLWGTQAWFFGFEGYMDIETIESNIFGAYFGHLTWTAYSSPLSRHQMNRHGECIGLDPTTDPAVKRLVQRAQGSAYGQPKIFTIVDTYSMTVTMFEAVRPPAAVLLCGSEGGMQRAVMCSYDWGTQTLYRETVLRMETQVLERMSRVGRLRFGMKRPLESAQGMT